VRGATTLSNTLLAYGATTLSNNLSVTGSTYLKEAVVAGSTFTASNSALFLGNTEFASNLTVRGSFNVETINYNNSNIVIYSSEEIRSNLLVEGVTEINSNLYVDGVTRLSNQLNLYGSEVVYNSGTISLSNATGASVLSASSNMMGINKVNPGYTLDVNGDINFSGLLYQNGSVFSGWNSNAFGNYINSNAAFKGPATAEDILLLYMSSNSLAFTGSHQTRFG
jgi:hypothetical protein